MNSEFLKVLDLIQTNLCGSVRIKESPLNQVTKLPFMNEFDEWLAACQETFIKVHNTA